MKNWINAWFDRLSQSAGGQMLPAPPPKRLAAHGAGRVAAEPSAWLIRAGDAEWVTLNPEVGAAFMRRGIAVPLFEVVGGEQAR